MSSSAPKRQRVYEASPFAYADAEPASGVPGEIIGGSTGKAADAGQGSEEYSRRQQAEAFEKGRQSVQQQLRTELDAGLAKNRAGINRALVEFGRERQDYYRRIEGEVVELALAIARKILHREVQIDSQALAGIVRITLEKLDTGTKVSLHVHPREAPDWRHYFACQAQDVAGPEIFEDASIAAGVCRIETSIGSTEIGFESQLKEIETGLLDLLAERPGAAPKTSQIAARSLSAPNPAAV
jgi:flagellar assembly protein FliH